MSLFFIDIVDRNQVIQDREGEDFPDLEAVRQAVILCAREIMADGVSRGVWWKHRTMRVRDDADNVVFTMPMVEALSEE